MLAITARWLALAALVGAVVIAILRQPLPARATPAPAAIAAIDNVQQQIDKYAVVKLTADLSSLSAAERTMLQHLIRAAEVMDDLYWQQSYGDRDALLSSIADPALRRLVSLNYGPWERLADFQPLLAGLGARPAGTDVYPHDVTLAELNTLPAAQRDNEYSIVRRDAAGKLKVIPFNQVWGPQLAAAATELRQAAALSPDPSLQRYLNARADALVSNSYRASDLAWMDMKSNHIELIIGPVETYEDRLLGLRASFEGLLLLKDLGWSERLARFTRLLPELQRALPVPAAYRQETPGTDSELNAYDVLLYAGEANTGGKVIAVNLPNDESVQLEKGARRLQLKNAMQAKFDQILKPIAGELIAEDQQNNVRFEAFFPNVMFHEVAHGLGIKFLLDGKGTVRAALRELASPLEEAKADILGLWLVTRLLASGELRDTTLTDHYVSFVAGIIRSVRFSTSDAHGQANMIQFNYFSDHGAFVRDAASGRYRVNVAQAQAATEALAARILKIQGDGDYAAAAAMVASEGLVRPELKADLARLTTRNIPVDVVFEQGAQVLGLQ